MEFFVTFGQQYAKEPHPSFPSAHPDGWVVVEAPDWDSARGIIVEELGIHWSGLYGKEYFMTDASRLYPKGELGRIPISDTETCWAGQIGTITCCIERSLDDPGHFEIRDDADNRLIDTLDVLDWFQAQSYDKSDFRIIAEDAVK